VLPAVACALLIAVAAGALEVEVISMREHEGHLWTDVRLSGLFAPRVAESLSRGMPATLRMHTELWRRRRGWFDRLETSFDAEVRIRYDVWSRAYQLERRGAPAVGVATLDSVEAALQRPVALRVGRVGDLEPGARYYVIVTATLKPLSVEDVEEIEGWLSGEVKTTGGKGFGVITELPRSVFDAVRNFVGFGDQKARAISPDFELRELFPEGQPAGAKL
jgi:DNA primase